MEVVLQEKIKTRSEIAETIKKDNGFVYLSKELEEKIETEFKWSNNIPSETKIEDTNLWVKFKFQRVKVLKAINKVTETFCGDRKVTESEYINQLHISVTSPNYILGFESEQM